MNPQQPVAPQVPQPQQPHQAPTSPYAMPPKKSNKVLIFSLIGGAIALITIGLVLFFLLAYPSMQSRGLAVKFMNHMTAGEITEAADLTDDSSGNRDFLKGLAEGVDKGKATLKESEFNKGEKSYYLFDISGADVKNARVTTKKASGRLVIEQFVTGDSLRLKGGVSRSDDSDKEEGVDEKEDKKQDKKTAKTTSSKCFAPSDFDVVREHNDIVFDASFPYYAGYWFEPDSAEPAKDLVGNGGVDDILKIVKANPGKDYSITLYGGIASNDASYNALANQRAEKVKTLLTANGVAASKISIGNPTGLLDENDTEEHDLRVARTVSIHFTPACNA